MHTHEAPSGDVYIHRHEHQHEDKSVHVHVHDTHERQSYWAAMGIGIVHGIAGVSHFLSLLPTLAFSNKLDSAMYLVGFGTGTILAMVLFSVLLGLLAKRANREKRDIYLKSITAFVGSGAIIVGIYWILNAI